jgi:glutathione gamma-glutamylcysteinyltransferase
MSTNPPSGGTTITNTLLTAPTTAAASVSTTPTAKKMASYYQRRLPETCVAFASKDGKEIFRSALLHGGLKSFYNLIEQFHTQTEPAFCGVSTLVMVLNALAVDPGQHWKGPWRWYEERMLNCCLDLEEVKETGITLKDFGCLAMCQGVSVDLTYCDEGKTSLDDFRKAVSEACGEEDNAFVSSLPPAIDNETSSNNNEDDTVNRVDNDEGYNYDDNNKVVVDDDENDRPIQVLVVSYSRKTLKQTGGGHFSPIAAYDEISDSVLILDTARFKYGAHWTKLPLVYEAMKPIDPDTGRSRGYALLSFVKTTTPTTPTGPDHDIDPKGPPVVDSPSRTGLQPSSILFRAKMNQNEQRRQYKEFVSSLNETYPRGDIPLKVVANYWTNETNGHPGRVWSIVEPLRASNEDEKERIYKIRLVLADLKKATLSTASSSVENDGDQSPLTEPPCCRSVVEKERQQRHKHCVTVDEAVFIVYLATLPEERRRQLVMNDYRSDAPDCIREEILKEAEVIACAIVVSDQLTRFEHK